MSGLIWSYSIRKVVCWPMRQRGTGTVAEFHLIPGKAVIRAYPGLLFILMWILEEQHSTNSVFLPAVLMKPGRMVQLVIQ